jgi:hypothetical protein
MVAEHDWRWIHLGTHNGRAIVCKVSLEDYEWALQWKWRFKLDKRGKKYYAVRHGRRTREDGKRVQCDFYMHRQILDRMEAVPPTDAHVIGEHGDGDSLNNQRDNLEWITRSHNCHTAKVKTPKCPVSGQFLKPNEPGPDALTTTQISVDGLKDL